MKESYVRLCSRLPDLLPAAEGDLSADPRSLRDLVQSLDLGAAEESAQHIAETLGTINRLKLEGAARLDAMEILRVPSAQLAATLNKRLVEAKSPGLPDDMALGEAAMRLQLALACGYRIALTSLTGPTGSVGFLRGKSVTAAALHAMLHGSDVLSIAYRLYQTPPPGAWQALHDVHRFMVALNQEARVLRPTQQEVELSTGTVYRHALLLALANPYRYSRREQLEVESLTRLLASRVQLRAGDERSLDVRVHGDADRGPGYLAEERDVGQAADLSMHLDDVSQYITAEMDRVTPETHLISFQQDSAPALKIAIPLLQKIVASWGARRSRTQERLQGGYALATVIGLNALHGALSGEPVFERFMSAAQGREGHQREVGELASSRPVSANGQPIRLQAEVFDHGLGGYRLVWPDSPQGALGRLHVGGLVGMLLPALDDGGPWDCMVGVVRWMRIDTDGRIDAGVQLLARHALPVVVRAGDDRGGYLAVPGLMLAPLSDPDVQYSSLLTSAALARDLREVEVSTPAEVPSLLRSGRRSGRYGLQLLETTDTFRHFGLTAVAPDATRADDAPVVVAHSVE